MQSFPHPLIAYELIPHSTQISQHYQKLEHHFETETSTASEDIGRHVQLPQNFIAQGLHSQQELFENNKCSK